MTKWSWVWSLLPHSFKLNKKELDFSTRLNGLNVNIKQFICLYQTLLSFQKKWFMIVCSPKSCFQNSPGFHDKEFSRLAKTRTSFTLPWIKACYYIAIFIKEVCWQINVSAAEQLQLFWGSSLLQATLRSTFQKNW